MRKRSFLAICALKCSFYQDRLGTNIGKALKKRLPLSQGQADHSDALLGRRRGLHLHGRHRPAAPPGTETSSFFAPLHSYWLETEHLPRQARGKGKETLRNKTLLQDAPPPPPNRWGPVPPPREVTVHDMEVEWSHKYGDSQLPALREVYP
eukprot:COSAG06_NODE_3331_length_5493_cov_4.197220_3_plen_151_part_00